MQALGVNALICSMRLFAQPIKPLCLVKQRVVAATVSASFPATSSVTLTVARLPELQLQPSENTMDINLDPNATVTIHKLTPVVEPAVSSAESNQVQEHSPKTDEWYAEQDRMYQQTRAEEQARVDAFIAQLRATLPDGITAARVAMDILKAEMKDPGYAWTWHCNVAMPFYDGLPENEPDRHKRANIGAGRVMRHVFDVDTMTQYQVDDQRTSTGS